MKETTKILIKNSILNCGLTTAIINGIISYFTLPSMEQMISSSLRINFLLVALGCGIICPLFGGLILKGVLAKNEQLDFEQKEDHFIARFIPNNLMFGAIVIGILTSIILWVIPYGIIWLIGFTTTLSRIVWIILVGFYSGVAASIAAYFGLLRVYFAQSKETIA